MSKITNISEDIIFKALKKNDPSLLGKIKLNNKVLNRYVAYHKQIERRMDGSSGGVCGAIFESLAKDNYFFSGAKFDENIRLKHIVFNDPEQIASISGFKPVISDCVEAFIHIKELLLKGEHVAFVGTSLQCYALQKYVEDSSNLITIDLIHTECVAPELLDKYVKEIEERYGSKVVDIKFNNKEFSSDYAKRFTLENGRVIYTHSMDIFDKLSLLGIFTPKTKNQEYFSSLDYRVADISIASYAMNGLKEKDLGVAYVSINTDKALNIFKRVKKRIVILLEESDIDTNCIRYRKNNTNDNVDVSILEKKSLLEISKENDKGKLLKFKKVLGAIKRGFKFAQYDMHACKQFLKYNFFTKQFNTDYMNDGFVYVAPCCNFKIPNSYKVELHGPLYIGIRRVKSSRLETRIRIEQNAQLIVKERCYIGAGSNIELYNNSILEIEDLQSNAEVTIICGEHIVLGSPVNMARNSTIRDTSGHIIATPGYKMSKPVTIGNHVWICTGSTIMPGVSIGDGSIIGACSFVNKKIPSFTMAQGTPAEIISSIKYFNME